MKLLARLFGRAPHAPLVSVVMASYNHAAFVDAALCSVLEQAVESLEIVVTDDGSTDGTADRVAAFAAGLGPEAPPLRLNAFGRNRGACIALNDAISRARGRYIAVLNSDDRFLPGKLRRQLAVLEARPEVGAVFGWPTFINEHGAPFDDPSHKDHAVFRVDNRPRHAWLRYFFDRGNALCHPTVLIRSAVYRQVGGYDARLAQVPDLDMWIRVCMQFDIHVIPEALVAFRIRDGLQNASAGRPEVVVRDAWERAVVLRHYLRLPEAELLCVFPEFREGPGGLVERLARHALALPYPFHHRFALDAWHDSLPSGATTDAGADIQAWQRFIAATGTVDLHGIRRMLQNKP